MQKNNTPLKIIFAGTPEFAASALQALRDTQHQVVAVYTQPDRPAGRGQKIIASPVKELALAAQIPVQQPKTLRDPAAQTVLSDLAADIMIVVAYGLLLPKQILEIPRLGCINIHASLLPRWRGAAPIQRAILNGDTETGISIMQMDEGLDTGPVLMQQSCPIHPTDTSQTLHDRLSGLGSSLLLKVLDQLTVGEIFARPQNNSAACYADKIKKSEAEISWQQSTHQLDRLIRAFNPWPVAYTFLADQIVRVWEATPIKNTSSQPPGTIVAANKQGIDVVTGDGLLRLLTIQLPGGRSLPAAEILKAKADLFTVGMRFGKKL